MINKYSKRSKLKDDILELRAKGKSYSEIGLRLDCSKGTVSYYCGKGQKEKSANRTRQRRKDIVVSLRVQTFRRNINSTNKSVAVANFTWQEVIDKYGWETTCYLTGRAIKLQESLTYHFDHIIPRSRGGNSSIENLGIACKEVNIAKNNMLVEEFIQLCKEVLEYNGYKVSKS